VDWPSRDAAVGANTVNRVEKVRHGADLREVPRGSSWMKSRLRNGNASRDGLGDLLDQLGTLVEIHCWPRCNVSPLQQLGLDAPEVIGSRTDELRLNVAKDPLRRGRPCSVELS
jgi:hypothetical protein